MGLFLEQIPVEIQDHIIKITKTSGLPETEESIEKIAEAWLEKKRAFEEQMASMAMEEVEAIDVDDPRGALAMTFSGSLITVGPVIDGSRKLSYASIGLRKDVPEMITEDSCNLSKDIEKGEVFEFVNGPIKKTSPIYKLMICKDDLPEEKQEEKLNEAVTAVIDDFVEINKTLIIN